MKSASTILVILMCLGVHGVAQDQNNQALIEPGETATTSCPGSCCCSANTQAPLGVMTDHIHAKGTWMLSYTYMDSRMDGFHNNSGSDMGANYTPTMVPQNMDMRMHMLMAMYGVTNRLTLMAMGGYTTCSMGMVMPAMYMYMNGSLMYMPASSMNSNTGGLTDSRISALYNFSRKSYMHLVASLGIDVPTGSIRATGTTMMGDGQRLPYDMQPGTGSWSLDPDFTYTRKYGKFFMGANAGAVVRANFNALGYKDGNQYHVSVWGGYTLLPFLSATLRAEAVRTERVAGYDATIHTTIYLENDPTTNPRNYGGDVASLYPGLNLHFARPALQRYRLMAEYGVPVYQRYNGSELKQSGTLLAGFQCAF